MLLHIPQVLGPAQLAHVTRELAAAPWGDGRQTAGPQSAKVKSCQQLPENSEQARALGNLAVAALETNPLFLSAALPRRVYPPLFSRYTQGMSFGTHIDNAIRQIPGTPQRMRLDLSATLFLAPPETYQGGALVIEDNFGTHSVKLHAGDMILYPAGALHHVAPVTEGARLAAIFWIQSLVRDTSERTLLFELDSTIRGLDPDVPAALKLTGIYHNLVRRWSEV